MNLRQRFIAALRGDKADRVPIMCIGFDFRETKTSLVETTTMS